MSAVVESAEELQLLESVLRTGEQTLDVGPVRIDHQQGQGNAEVDERVIPGDLHAKEIVANGHRPGNRHGGDDAAKRDVSGGKHEQRENAHGNCHFNGCKGNEHAQRCIDALSATKAGEDRPDMTDHGAEPCNDLDHCSIFEGRMIFEGHLRVEEVGNQQNGYQSFCYVGKLHNNAPLPSEDTKGIRASHVARAFGSNVESEEPLTDDQCRGDGTDQIALSDDDDQPEDWIHRGQSYDKTLAHKAAP